MEGGGKYLYKKFIMYYMYITHKKKIYIDYINNIYVNQSSNIINGWHQIYQVGRNYKNQKNKQTNKKNQISMLFFIVYLSSL